MNNKPQYSDHLDTIVALITHLAMTKHKSRTPSKMARQLSLDQDKTLYVLNNFKGLFRRSCRKQDKRGEHYYTLQLRYARRWLEDADDDDQGEDSQGEPLESNYLSTLLDFVANRAEQEQESRRQKSSNYAMLIGAWIAAIAAIIAAILSFVATQNAVSS